MCRIFLQILLDDVFGFSSGSQTEWVLVSSGSSTFLLIIIVVVRSCGLTDGRSPCSGVVGVDQRRGREPRGGGGPALLPRLGEREHLSGEPRQEARHLFLPAQDATFGLEGVGHPVGEAGHQAGQLQVTMAFLLQQRAESLEEDRPQGVHERSVT